MANLEKDADVYITIQINKEQFEINVKSFWKLTSIIRGFIRNDYFKRNETSPQDIDAYINGEQLDKEKKIVNIFKESKKERIEDLIITLVNKNQRRPKRPESKSQIIIMQQIKPHLESSEQKQEQREQKQLKQIVPEKQPAQKAFAFTSDVRSKGEPQQVNFYKSQEVKMPSSRLKPDLKEQKSTEFSYNSKIIQDSEFNTKQAFWIDTFHKIMKKLEEFTSQMNWKISALKEGQEQEIDFYIEEIFLRVRKEKQILTEKIKQNQANHAELEKKIKELSAENINLKAKQNSANHAELEKKIKELSAENINLKAKQNDAKFQKMSDSLSILKKKKCLFMKTINKEQSSEKQQQLFRRLRDVEDMEIKSLQGYFSLTNQNLNIRTLTNLFSNYQNKPNLISILEFEDNLHNNHHLAVYTPLGISQKSIKNLISKNKNPSKFFIYDLETQKKFNSDQVSMINIGFHSIELFGHILGIETSQTSKVAVKVNHGKVNNHNDDFWKQMSGQEGTLKSIELYQVQFINESKSSKKIIA